MANSSIDWTFLDLNIIYYNFLIEDDFALHFAYLSDLHIKVSINLMTRNYLKPSR